MVFGDSLIVEFSSDEVETAIAHELGHHVNKDIPIGVSVESAVTLIGLYLSNLGLQWGMNYFGFEGVWEQAALLLFGVVIGAYGLITMPG